MISMNKAFMVAEADDMAEVQKDIGQWTDLCTFLVISIMDSREAVAVLVSDFVLPSLFSLFFLETIQMLVSFNR